MGEQAMTRIQVRTGISLWIALFTVAPAALGDAPCNKDFRDVTPAERSQITTILQSAQSALPPAPEGWIIVVDTSNEISVPAKMCRDHETVPWRHEINRTYRQVADAETRNKLLTDQASQQAAAMKQRQPRLEAAQAKYQKVMSQITELNQKRDYAGAEKLAPQLKAAEKEYEAILNETNDPAAVAATEKAFNQDLQMTIAVRVNPINERAGPGAKAVAPPAGAKSAQRWHVEDENESTDRALFLFGAWNPATQGGLQPALRADVAPSGAHRLSVLVTGDADRVTQTVAAIDFAKLAAIVR